MAKSKKTTQEKGAPVETILQGKTTITQLWDPRTRMLTCPRCLNTANIVEYTIFSVVPQFVHQLNPIVRCRNCGHCFSPRDIAYASDALLKPVPKTE